MLPRICKRSKKIICLLSVILLTFFSQPVWAAGPPEPSVFSNPLAMTFMILMLVLLIIIGILAYLLIGAADLEMKKKKIAPTAPVAVSIMIILLLVSPGLFAQAGDAPTSATASSTGIGGLSASTFYIMASVIFLELLIILVLLFNIRFLLKVEKEKIIKPVVLTEEVKRTRLSWWDKFNKLRPVSQEAELDLGHDYDGIRELNNRLPPWWLYGFYLTIVVAFIYLWRFHISHSGPSSIEEYETAIAKADVEVGEYLKKKGDNVDENTVTLLTAASDLEAGKTIFSNPANCVTCHRADGGGIVGPNLTDDYWIYGGSVKDIFKTVKYGTNKGMRSWKDDFSAKQIAQVVSYIKSLHGTNPPNPKEPAGQFYKEEDMKPSAGSIKVLIDSIKAKDNKVTMN
ncbi:MAG: cbb3-type cytochrome c oxidase N-terminal domain-containing protein [Chitinophagaceae bacterium]